MVLAVAASVLLAVPPSAGAQSGGGLEVELPSNTDCRGAAVIAKTTVVEDAAAANMLAEALRVLSPGGAQRCLLDAGLPPGRGRPPNEAVPPDAVYRSSAGLATTVYVVGGPAAIPNSWLSEQLGVTGFTRVAGADRWQTQQSVAAAMLALAVGRPVQAYDPESVAAATRGLPPNGDCWGTAVLAKLAIAEERAAANMLAAALTAISGDPDSRCLVDVGDPGADRPPSAVAVAEAAQASGAYLLGGEVAVPQPWIDNGFDIRFLERISGPDRWATQSAVAETIIEIAQGGTLPHQYTDREGYTVSIFEDYIVSDEIRDEEFDPKKVPPEVWLFHCGSQDTLNTETQVERATEALTNVVETANSLVRDFFAGQQDSVSESEKIIFSFKTTDNPIIKLTKTEWTKGEVFGGNHGNDIGNSNSGKCVEKAKAIKDKSMYVLVDQERQSIGGWARVYQFQASQPTLSKWGPSQAHAFYNTMAHELGHGWLGLYHTHRQVEAKLYNSENHNKYVYGPTIAANPELVEDPFDSSVPSACSLLSYCRNRVNPNDDDVWIGCGQRELLGWGNGPATPYGPCVGGEIKMSLSTPSPPGRPVLSERDTDFISITWPDASGVVAYHEVNWRRADSGSSWQTRTLSNSLAIFGTDGLSAGDCYEFRVRAGNGEGESDWSPLTEFCTTGGQPPDAPDPPSSTPRDGQLSVSWSAPAGNGAAVTGYQVRWRQGGSGSWDSTTVRGRSYTIPRLSNGVTYTVQVRARNSEGWGDWSLSVRVTLPPPVVSSVVISEGPVNASRTSAGSCSGNDCYDLAYDIRNLGGGPYTLECWFNGSRAWRGQWSGRASTGCYYSAAFSGSAYVVIDDVKSNTLSISAKASTQQSTERVTIARGSVNSRSSCTRPCYDLDYRIEGLGGGPYTLECWFNGRQAWRGQWSGRASTGCYFSGSFRGTVHVVIDGVKSNTLTF